MPGSFIPNISELARTLTRRGDRFTYVNEHVPNAIWHDDVRAGGAELVLADSQKSVYDALVALRPDIVHTHFIGYTFPATLAAWRTGARLFWHLHSGQLVPPTAARLARSHMRYSVLGRRAQRFITVSESLASQLRAWGLDRKKTTVVNNAIDTTRFRPATPDERLLRRERFGLAADEAVVAFFGRDTYCKGTDVLIEALNVPLPLTLIAVGLPQDTARALARRVKTIFLDRVADTRDVYWASDVMVMPSRYEAAPYTLMEALACGLPTVASDIASIRELGEKAASSVRFVSPEDSASLREALASVTRSRSRSDLDAPTREFFGLRRWVREVLALYE
jgi:glycosyltransferase involved in cell wall biosynthesis